MYSAVFVNTYYGAFLSSFYRVNPHIVSCGYQAQLDCLNRELFGDSDFYSMGLKKAGWDAVDIIINCEPLQKQWAREYDYEGDAFTIGVGQIRKLSPDVVYIQDMHQVSREFIQAIRPFTKLIVGQIASPAGQGIPFDLYDIIISSFPHYVSLFRKYGLTSYYQPLAFDARVIESVQTRPYSSRPIACSFVGGISGMHGKAYELLEYLAGTTPVEFWGYGAATLPETSPVRPRHRGEAWGKDMFALMASSKITVNRHIDVAENFANNMRLYEATGCGAMMITDYKDNLNDLFEIGREVVAYRSPEECAALINYYIAHPEEAERIARAGQERTLRDHSYTKRMRHTAEVLERHLRYARERDLYASTDTADSNKGHAPISSSEITPAMVSAWKDPRIPFRQRALVQRQLEEMYRGAVASHFKVLADILAPYVETDCGILEIGCASGYYYEILEYLLNKRISYTGVDYSEALISMARDYYPSARFFAADGSCMFFPDRSFEYVISSCVLLHVPNYREHIFETARVAKDIIVAHRTPVCRTGKTRYLKKFAYGVETVELVFNEEEFIREFSVCGFRLVEAMEYLSCRESDLYEVTYLFRR